MAGRALHAIGVITAALLAACSSNRAGPDGLETSVSPADSAAVTAIRAAAQPITGAATDYDPLIAMAAGARVVFLGEQTHGTHEFYRERARITQRLIREHGFRAVALEADWPEAERVNRYVHGLGSDRTAVEALGAFTDFPRWMWRNTDIRDLVEWLRTHNAGLPVTRRVSVFGIDVYSLYTSPPAVIEYLSGVDTAAASRARAQYGCLTRHGSDPQGYGAAVSGSTNCRAPVAAVLAELQQRAASMPSDPVAANALFSALRNAQAVVSSEEYFRSLYAGGVNTWNVRDQRMEETLLAIDQHLTALASEPARIVAWAHNTHSGDARATEMAQGGELNVGQLIRNRLTAASVLVGFFTYDGSVMAAREWDQPGRVFDVHPAMRGSYSHLFHAANPASFLLMLRDAPVAQHLDENRLERAIGVIYSPST